MHNAGRVACYPNAVLHYPRSMFSPLKVAMPKGGPVDHLWFEPGSYPAAPVDWSLRNGTRDVRVQNGPYHVLLRDRGGAGDYRRGAGGVTREFLRHWRN